MQAKKVYDVALIEDDPIMGESLCMRFELEGFSYKWLKNLEDAKKALHKYRFHLVLSDIRLPDGNSETLLKSLLSSGNSISSWIVFTGYATVDQAVRMMQYGVVDYLAKPFDLEQLISKITSKLDQNTNCTIPPNLFLGTSSQIQHIQQIIIKMANHPQTGILIQGETGVGKERVAQLLHHLTYPDQKQPFVALNCGAISDNLLESELFGHEQGAFTGAQKKHLGVLERANGGTLLLDEIGDMPENMQVKLLRAIQERNFMRVGGETLISFKTRIICATHKNLAELVEIGAFREDLYHRINIITLPIPPLRARAEDIIPIASQILKDLSPPAPNSERYTLAPPVEIALLSYRWPGNIRELKNCLERATVMCEGNIINIDDLGLDPKQLEEIHDGKTLKEHLNYCERNYILTSLSQQQGKIIKTAEALGLSRKNLWEKMQKLNISSQ